jgi:hypothetical protein
VFLGVGAMPIFLTKLDIQVREWVFQVKKDITLELLWEICEISMVKVGRIFSSLS